MLAGLLTVLTIKVVEWKSCVNLNNKSANYSISISLNWNKDNCIFCAHFHLRGTIYSCAQSIHHYNVYSMQIFCPFCKTGKYPKFTFEPILQESFLFVELLMKSYVCCWVTHWFNLLVLNFRQKQASKQARKRTTCLFQKSVPLQYVWSAKKQALQRFHQEEGWRFWWEGIVSGTYSKYIPIPITITITIA